MAYIKFEHIQKSFDGQKVLEDINISIYYITGTVWMWKDNTSPLIGRFSKGGCGNSVYRR